jgi:hypothetical protein
MTHPAQWDGLEGPFPVIPAKAGIQEKKKERKKERKKGMGVKKPMGGSHGF